MTMIEGLTNKERRLFKSLSSPQKIQDFLDSLKINFERSGETCSSPRVVMKRRSAHCIEAAILAAAAMKFNGQKALLLDLKANQRDYDHTVCLFKDKGRWGAVSKSNHAVLRFRDPVYLSVRELAMSYFHEYTNMRGEKTMRSYSRPFSLAKYGDNWVTADFDLWQIANELDEAKHFSIMPKNVKLRRADRMERKAGNLVEYTG